MVFQTDEGRSLGRLHLQSVKWMGGCIGVNEEMGRVYFPAFTLNGRMWAVGDFCHCEDEIFRIVGAFQATSSFVGLWAKKGEVEEIQKMGHAYMLVAPLFWFRVNSELVLPKTTKWNDGGHIDVLPQWIGEPKVAMMRKISVKVGVSSAEDSAIVCWRSTTSDLNRGVSLQPQLSPLTKTQYALLTDDALQLLDHHVAKRWNPVFRARHVRLVHRDRGHSSFCSLPVYYTEDSSDDESEKYLIESEAKDSIGKVSNNDSHNEEGIVSLIEESSNRGMHNKNSEATVESFEARTNSPCLTTTEGLSSKKTQVDGSDFVGTLGGVAHSRRQDNGEASLHKSPLNSTQTQNMSKNKKQPLGRLQAMAEEGIDSRAGLHAPDVSRSESPPMTKHSYDFDNSDVDISICVEGAELCDSSDRAGSRVVGVQDDDSMSSIEFLRHADESSSSSSPLITIPRRKRTSYGSSSIHTQEKCAVEEIVLPGTQYSALSGLATSSFASMCSSSCPPSSSSREDSPSVSQYDTEWSEEENIRFVSSGASSDGSYDSRTLAETIAYTEIQKRSATVFKSGEIRRLRQAAVNYKWRKLVFFNTVDGRRLRLQVANHQLRQCPGQPRSCALCASVKPRTKIKTGHRTSYRCETCGDVPLCTRLYPGQKETCWTLFHSRHTLKKRTCHKSSCGETVQP